MFACLGGFFSQGPLVDSDRMIGLLVELGLTSRRLKRSSKKCLKEEGVETERVKRAIEQGQPEMARIHAANAIRKKHDAINHLKLSERVEAVSSRLKSALETRKISASIAQIVGQLDRALEAMPVEKVALVMESFESQFEDLDVQGEVLEAAVGKTTSLSAPQEEVDALIGRVAELHGLEFELADTPLAEPQERREKDELLNSKLSKLRAVHEEI